MGETLVHSKPEPGAKGGHDVLYTQYSGSEMKPDCAIHQEMAASFDFRKGEYLSLHHRTLGRGKVAFSHDANGKAQGYNTPETQDPYVYDYADYMVQG